MVSRVRTAVLLLLLVANLALIAPARARASKRNLKATPAKHLFIGESPIAEMRHAMSAHAVPGAATSSQRTLVEPLLRNQRPCTDTCRSPG